MTLKLYANNKEIVKFLSGKCSLIAGSSKTNDMSTEILIGPDEYDISTNGRDIFIISQKKSVI